MNRSTTSLASSHTQVASSLKPRCNESALDLEKREKDGRNRPHVMGDPAESSSAQNEAPKTISQGPPVPQGPGGLGGPGAPGPDTLYKPKTLRFWLTLLANFLALFLVALDRTIVATAIPRITDEYHSQGDIGWYGSAYMLTTSASQLLFGRLFKFYNTKWTFLTSVVIFEVGSAICGAAPTSPVFIFGRAVAGFGSAGIFSGAMMIMIPMIPLPKRPMFQSMFGMVFGISSVLGPLLGGAFTSSALTWRWCFYINLPIGGFTLIFMIFFWNPPAKKTEPAPLMVHIKRLDPLGTFFCVPAVVCLLLALQWGGATYAWANWRIILLLVLCGVLALAFAAVQIIMPDTASIPPRVIKQRSVLFSVWFTFFIAGSMLMLVYYLPLWFQTVERVSAFKSGIYTLPLVLSLLASSLINGVATAKIGYYVPSMLLCPCIMAAGEGLLSTLTRGAPQSHWVGYQFMSGFGLGMGMQTGSLAVQTVLPMADVSMGIACIFFSQQLGGAIFTTVGQAILSNLLVSRLAGVSGIDPARIVESGATELADVVPAKDLTIVLDAYNHALTRIFLAAMGLAFAALLCALAVEWKSIKKPGAGAPVETAKVDPEKSRTPEDADLAVAGEGRTSPSSSSRAAK
ncbi:hypothetical protein KVR01_003775 [Diaporthe batatas]|uniref:uncharacterized protein n=1 Tax=Diaporthe batatas TaxID=748121 RepID=UPI001D041C2A|nr:uncharacterized protein KVR01_003775 [Diaporthe batatas]KAG8168086.1 hypothetical protein KVR01_003775 [Diaporthe batatas]